MKLALLALFAVLPAVLAAVPIPFTNCGVSTDHIKISSATATVWPPVLGQNDTFTISAALDETLTSGTYIVQVSFDGFQVLNQQGNIGDLPGITLPIPAGPINLSKSVNLPSIIPAGSTVVANVTALDQNGQELLCLSLTVTIPSEMEAEMMPEDSDDEMIDFAGLADLAFEDAEYEEAIPSKVAFGQVMQDITDALSTEITMYDGIVELDDPVPVPYTNCGQASDVITVESVTSTVWPPSPGTTAIVVANLLVNAQVNDGTYNAQLSVDGFQLLNTTGNISDFVTLPIAKGPFSITKNVTLPSSIPFSGSIGVQVAAGESSGMELFCLGLNFNI